MGVRASAAPVVAAAIGLGCVLTGCGGDHPGVCRGVPHTGRPAQARVTIVATKARFVPADARAVCAALGEPARVIRSGADETWRYDDGRTVHFHNGTYVDDSPPVARAPRHRRHTHRRRRERP